MGRPRKTGNLSIFRIKLRLWEGEDDDLIAFLQAVPTGKRSAAVKTAMRSGKIETLVIDDLADEDDLASLADDLLM
ncbi:MAG: hypothetical protein HN965_01110 [Anaerolineae bacterium]|jgi:hypothetical protein|nr:hypothetical protein [Anaerolineae bacterium]MBT7988400.1 hypothetical protein [Anaerolineae bacterium]